MVTLDTKILKVRDAGFNSYEVYYEGGGEVPKVLQGRWTSPFFAQRAIDTYLTTRPKRGRKTDEKSDNAV